MTDKADLWREIATKYGLLDTPYEKLVSWNFADFIFNSGFDNVSSTIKARKAGFAECIDSEEMFRAFFVSLRDGRSSLNINRADTWAKNARAPPLTFQAVSNAC